MERRALMAPTDRSVPDAPTEQRALMAPTERRAMGVHLAQRAPGVSREQRALEMSRGQQQMTSRAPMAETRLISSMDHLAIGSNASSAPRRRCLFDPRMRLEREVTIILLGVSGAGKSTLGNLLVFGEMYPEFEEGFKVGHGSDAQTTKCNSKTCGSEQCELTVFDTPGVPDTSREKTLMRFDDVVLTLRGIPSLNAFVFLLNAGRKEENDYEAYRSLFGQYRKLPCPIVMVCKVDSAHDPPRVRQEKEDGAIQLMKRVISTCNLGDKRVHKYLLRNGKAGEDDVEKLRWFLCFMPGVSLAERTLMTSSEMKDRLSRLSDRKRRLEELQEKEIPRLENIQKKLREQIEVLQNKIDECEQNLKTVATGTAILTGITAGLEIATLGTTAFLFCAPGAVGGIWVSQITSQMSGFKGAKEIAEETFELNSADLDKKRREAESGQVDPLELEKARVEYEQMKQLSER